MASLKRFMTAEEKIDSLAKEVKRMTEEVCTDVEICVKVVLRRHLGMK